MKFLCEIKDNTKLYVKTIYNTVQIMDKKEFIQSEYFTDSENITEDVYIAEPQPASIDKDDIRQMIDYIYDSGEQYEDWDDDVWSDIKNAPEVTAFIEYMNKVFEKYMTYMPGEMVDYDAEVTE